MAIKRAVIMEKHAGFDMSIESRAKNSGIVGNVDFN